MIINTSMKLNVEEVFVPFLSVLASIKDDRCVPFEKEYFKKIATEKFVLKRTRFYIEKEVKSLKKLYSKNSMNSKIEILNQDFEGKMCACIYFKLGTEERGYTIYKYCVYKKNKYFYCPIFSVEEKIKYLVFLLKDYVKSNFSE